MRRELRKIMAGCAFAGALCWGISARAEEHKVMTDGVMYDGMLMGKVMIVGDTMAPAMMNDDKMMDGKMMMSGDMMDKMMPGMSMMPGMMMPAMMDGKMMAGAKTFRVTITNLTKGQPFSGPVFLTHSNALRLWQPGAKASFGVQRIAEEGNIGPALHGAMMAGGGKAVCSVTTQFGVMPGGSTSLLIMADPAHPFLSGAFMLANTNDGFTGLYNVNVLDMTAARTFDVIGYDAGTEKNTERKSDLIALMGSGRDEEGGVIMPHTGIRGNKDAPAMWNFSGAVARITVEPVTGDMSAAMSDMMMHPPMMMNGMMNGKMMMMGDDGRMMPMMMKDGKMMAMMNGKMMEMPKGAQMMMVMPDGSTHPMMMQDGKMMMKMDDGSMMEAPMMGDAMMNGAM